MLRSVLGFVAGCLVAGIVAGIVQRVGFQAYPPSEPIAPSDPNPLDTYLRSAPAGALLLLLAARMGAALAGSWVAIRIGRETNTKAPAIGVGLMMLIASIPLAISAMSRVWFPFGLLIGIPLATSIPMLANLRSRINETATELTKSEPS